MKYLLNKDGYFFHIEDDVELDMNKTLGCSLYASEEDLREAACRVTGCENDELGIAFEIEMRNGNPMINDQADFFYDFIADEASMGKDVTIEEYLSNFEM